MDGKPCVEVDPPWLVEGFEAVVTVWLVDGKPCVEVGPPWLVVGLPLGLVVGCP